MRTLLVTIIILLAHLAQAQQPKQTIRGVVLDESSNTPVPYANVLLAKTVPVLGATTDSTGAFRITDVPIGRYDIEVSIIGYEQAIVRNVEVTPSKELILSISIKEVGTKLKEVIVKHKAVKSKPLNNMATLSARMLSVEEAKKYAGGFDDPSRLVSSFAGVASNIGSNAIVVRGNAPQYLQWKMEGVEIPNPNHFADLAAFGGGGLTALSTNLLANSDFFTGAFPAEYGNALSGVFDIFMRNGNNMKQENTFQAGLIGLDASSEGPFKKGGPSSYLFNYRYATLSVIGPFLPENARGVKYQDLSFKLNFPTRKVGTFSVWGIGLLDGSGSKIKYDSTEWTYASAKEGSTIKQYMGAAGLSHKYFINPTTYIKTIFSTTMSGIDLSTNQLNSSAVAVPENKIFLINKDYTLTSFINKKVSSKHTNRTGVSVRGMGYDMDLEQSLIPGTSLQPVIKTSGISALVTAYSNSSIDITEGLTMKIGINAQWFTLNNHYTVEPRLGFKKLIAANQSIALAYGLHSRLERLNYYFNKDLATGQENVNKNLDFSKAHHLVAGYDWNISELLHFKTEIYYQQLFNIPVIADSSFSILNMQNDWFFAQKLQNTGLGRNYGIDLTLEKYLSQGYYYMVTASLFNSEYTGGDAIWHSTRYNRNYLFNFLAGKEWRAGHNKQNAFSVNIRFSYQGGDHYSPINEQASAAAREAIFDETNAFRNQLPPSFIAHFTTSYKINKKHIAQEFAFKMLNITGQKDFSGFEYNLFTNLVDKREDLIFVPNLSYRIEF